LLEQFDIPLAPLTTLRIGGPARRLVTVTTEAELVQAVTECDRQGAPLLVLAGGSNVVIGDDGFDGTAVLVRTSGIHATVDGDLVRLDVAAGEPWDAVVARCVAAGYAGVECLSGIPGSTGATPMQNVGAYGQEVSETVSWVRVLDRRTRTVVTLDAAECGFRYRNSIFKSTGRYVVLAVGFRLAAPAGMPVGSTAAAGPIRYAELARTLGVEVGEPAPLAEVRAAVLGLRGGKGMVLDPADHDTWSVGSFFTNPILEPGELAALDRRVAERLGVGLGGDLGGDTAYPRYPEAGGRTKVSAAWLIERAGVTKGYGAGPAMVSTKHTLALTNRGGAKSEDLLALAREVRDRVREAFGIELVNEPVLVGVSL
jgi:UDP-N-acetylmuramate dehydrogenase